MTLLITLLLLAGPQDAEPKKTNEDGFIIDDGMIMTKANCTNCHSAKIVLQNRADADGWIAIIRTMQQKHGLWQLPEPIEKEIVEYLARNYTPQKRGRRLPLKVPAAWLAPTDKKP